MIYIVLSDSNDNLHFLIKIITFHANIILISCMNPHEVEYYKMLHWLAILGHKRLHFVKLS